MTECTGSLLLRMRSSLNPNLASHSNEPNWLAAGTGPGLVNLGDASASHVANYSYPASSNPIRACSSLPVNRAIQKMEGTSLNVGIDLLLLSLLAAVIDQGTIIKKSTTLKNYHVIK